MIWLHEGWDVWSARERGLVFRAHPNCHPGRYYLLALDLKGRALFDAKGELEDVKAIAQLWLESRAK